MKTFKSYLTEQEFPGGNEIKPSNEKKEGYFALAKSGYPILGKSGMYNSTKNPAKWVYWTQSEFNLVRGSNPFHHIQWVHTEDVEQFMNTHLEQYQNFMKSKKK